MMNPATPRPDRETLDSFYHGRIRILQPKRGYRFAVDAPLLADFIRTRPGDEALEIGTGSGVISLLLSVKPFRKITAIEIQPGLAGLAGRSVELNGLGGRIEIVRADLRTFEPGRRFDLIFSNPPYIRKETGFLSASPEKSAAKHELHGDIGEILRKTAEWLAPEGRACFVYPEKRRTDFARAADARGFRVLRFRHVLPREAEPANLFLAELGFGTAHPEILPPLVLFGPDGKYTAAAEGVFSGP